jgi:radical SAM protein with 4Fe4S-binding SPASM domain
MEMNASYVPRVCGGLIHRERNGLHLLLHPHEPRWLVTNRLGREVIELADGTRDMEEISGTLAARYGKEPDDIVTDVENFLGSLKKAGMLDREYSTRPTSSHPVKIGGLFLHLTDRCNLRCAHCYVGGAAGPVHDLAAGKICDLVDELADMGGRSVTMSGGEPLLHPDWPEIVAHAARKLRVTLNTNGTLIDRRVAGVLNDVKPYVQVSLDGPDSTTHDRIRGEGSFDSALRGIRTLLDAGLGEYLILSMTLMRSNISRAPEMIDLAASLGIPKIRFLPLHRQGRALSASKALDAPPEDYFSWFRHVYLERKPSSPPVEVYGGLIGFLLHTSGDTDEHWCSIGRSVVVDSAGDVHPCALLMDRSLILGNIHSMSLRQIETSPTLSDLTLECSARKDTIPKCRACIWRNLCRASCPAFPFLEKGTFGDTDDFCDFRRGLYEDAVFGVAGGLSQRRGGV